MQYEGNTYVTMFHFSYSTRTGTKVLLKFRSAKGIKETRDFVGLAHSSLFFEQ